MSDELTREQYCLIIEELPVEYTDAVGENIDKLLKHDAALRAQLAACQEEARCNQEKWEVPVSNAKVREITYSDNELQTLEAYCTEEMFSEVSHVAMLNLIWEVRKLRAQLAACQEQVRLTKGAMDAQDGREREAGEKCGVDYNIHGCDWPDAAAELIVHLRAKLTAMEQDNKRLDVENNQLWAVFKTCHGCKYVVPGVMFGCPIQHHIDLSGNCNQYEKAGE